MAMYDVTISYTYTVDAPSEAKAEEMALEDFGDEAPRPDEVNVEVVNA